MIRRHTAVVFVCLPVLALLAASPGRGEWTTDEILNAERKLVQYRADMHSGRVALVLRHSYGPASPGEKRYEISFEGTSLRADVEGSAGNNRYASQRVVTDHSFIRGNGSDKAVQLFGETTRPKNSLEVPDPRFLGIIVWHFESINQFGYEKHFLRPDRFELRATERVLEGQRTLAVSYQTKTPSGRTLETEYWLAIERENQPVLISVKSPGQSATVRSIQVTLDQYGPAGVWFPRTVTYRKEKNGSLIAEEVVEVESAAFGADLPAEEFTIAGLGLEPGTTVNSDGQPMTWTGDSLQPSGIAFRDKLADSGSAWKRWIIGALAILLSLVSGAALWARWRKED